MKRTDEFGRAFAGSQLQMQIYVNRRPHELAEAVVHAIADTTIVANDIVWKSPLESAAFAEYQDATFLEALDLGALQPKLAQFWPSRGPRWDAIGSVQQTTTTQMRGVVLIEAKSYPHEVYGAGCQARPTSRSHIEVALVQAQHWFGAAPTYRWTGRLYQYANRLAHVYFFRHHVGLAAWLVNLCFVNDPHSPTTIRTWQQSLTQIKYELGFRQQPIPYTVDVFLPARLRNELLTGA